MLEELGFLMPRIVLDLMMGWLLSSFGASSKQPDPKCEQRRDRKADHQQLVDDQASDLRVHCWLALAVC